MFKNKVLILLAIATLAIIGVVVFHMRAQRRMLCPSGLYKITTQAGIDKANPKEYIKLLKLDKDSGFIHAAYGRQVKDIIKKFFKKEKTVLVAKLCEKTLEKNGTIIKPEANKPGGTIFPHLYGTQAIPKSAVKKILIFKKGPLGNWTIADPHVKAACSCCG